MMRRIRVYRVDVEKESGDWASEIFLKREGSKVNFDRMVFNKMVELHPEFGRDDRIQNRERTFQTKKERDKYAARVEKQNNFYQFVSWLDEED